MKKFFLVWLSALLLSAGFIQPTEAVTNRIKQPTVFTQGVTFQSTTTHTGNTTFAGNQAVTGNTTIGGTLGVTGASTLASLGVTGAATIGTTLGVTGAVSLTVPLTKANIGNQSKRLVFKTDINGGGTLADGTTYKALIVPGRAGTITKVTGIAGTAAVGGTSTIKVLKGVAGNTCLSAASVDPTTMTSGQALNMALTSTGADLAITASGAGSGIYVEWITGTQTTDAATCSISVEFEPDDY